jgi:hypothetical protein
MKRPMSQRRDTFVKFITAPSRDISVCAQGAESGSEVRKDFLILIISGCPLAGRLHAIAAK